MDARTFDALTRSLRGTGSRRGLLVLLAALPLVGGLVALFDPDAADAKGRRKRRKKAHKHGRPRPHGKHKKKHHKKKCKPQSRDTTCTGKCGSVKNNCRKTVDCGSCACDPPCGICQTCQGEPGVCVEDAVGTPCGEPGQVCQGDGSCACDTTSCPACTTCGQDGACQGCTGCCDEDICVEDCPACQTCDDGQCVSCGVAGQICCNGECVSGVCCEDAECAPTGDDCVGNQCQCGAGPVCAGDPELCCGGDCIDTESSQDNCGDCGNVCQDPTPFCWDGECVCGDVCADGCQFDSVQDATEELPAGSTIHICVGIYGAINIGNDLTLIGAGDGSDPGSDTILDANNNGRVVDVSGGVTATLQGMRITGGQGDSGAGVRNNGTLTMAQCTVTGNTSSFTAGGIYNDGSVTLNDTDVTGNTATDGAGGGVGNFGTLILNGASSVANNTYTSNFGGGGVYNEGTVTLNDTSSVANNEATNAVGGGIANNGTVTLNHASSVSDNTSRLSGGGIFNNASLTLNDTSSVTGNEVLNTLLGDGGGIANNGGSVTLSATSRVCSNTPDQCTGFSDPNGACQAVCPP